MATLEQCEKELKKRIKTKEDVFAFPGKFRKERAVQRGDGVGENEAHFVDNNIKQILKFAADKGQPGIDELGRELGIPTEAEQRRLQQERLLEAKRPAFSRRALKWIGGIVTAIIAGIVLLLVGPCFSS